MKEPNILVIFWVKKIHPWASRALLHFLEPKYYQCVGLLHPASTLSVVRRCSSFVSLTRPKVCQRNVNCPSSSSIPQNERNTRTEVIWDHFNHSCKQKPTNPHSYRTKNWEKMYNFCAFYLGNSIRAR